MFRPDSYRLNAGSVSILAYLQTLESHLKNTSSKYSVPTTNDDTGGTGDYGIVIDPDDTNEKWQTALYYDDSSGQMQGFMDPQGSISNPLDQTSGSSDTSSTVQFLTDTGSLGNPTSRFLVAERHDTLNMLIAGQAGSTSNVFQDHGMFGRIFVPTHGDGRNHYIDGLGIQGTEFGNLNTTGQYRIGKSTWVDASQDNDTNINAFPDSSIRIRTVGVETSNENQILGDYKTFFLWTGRYDHPARIEDRAQKGGMLTFAGRYAIPWDPDVRAQPT